MKPAYILASIALSLSMLSVAATKALPPSSSSASAPLTAPVDQKRLLDGLDRAIKTYKPAPDPQSWQAVFESIKQVVAAAAAKPADLSSLNKKLVSDLGMHYSDNGSIKTWCFPKIPEAQQFLLEYREVVPSHVVGRGRRAIKTPPTLSSPKLQVFNCPTAVSVNDARLIGLGSDSSKNATRCLVILGVELNSGAAWLQAFKSVGGHWAYAPELFAGVPPFLLQNLQGKVSFSGNSLVVTADTPKTHPLAEGNAGEVASGGYKVTLSLVGDHYVLDSKSGMDPATSVALQVTQAIQSGKIDLVRAWMVDAKLAAIPGYLGLYGKGTATPLRIIPMASPQNGAVRFRIVTFAKDDLVMDVGKVKAQWAVKALFIAPPDALAKKLLSTTPAAANPDAGAPAEAHQ